MFQKLKLHSFLFGDLFVSLLPDDKLHWHLSCSPLLLTTEQPEVFAAQWLPK